MSRRYVVVIINPVSGSRSGSHAGRRRAELAATLLRRHGVEGEIFVTERAGHALELSAAARERGASIVLAWGGDGTVNEVASALVHGPTLLGIVPAGSGDGLARELRIARRPEAAFAGALAATERCIDVGELGGRFYFNVAGVGFDAAVAQAFNAGTHRGGLFSYVMAVGRELRAYVSAEYEIAFGPDRIRSRALMVVLANSRQYGNGVRIAPRARLDDGELELVIVEAASLGRTLWRARHLCLGSLARERTVTMRAVTDVEISSTSPMVFHVDGETVQDGHSLRGRIHRGALRILAPPASHRRLLAETDAAISRPGGGGGCHGTPI